MLIDSGKILVFLDICVINWKVSIHHIGVKEILKESDIFKWSHLFCY